MSDADPFRAFANVDVQTDDALHLSRRYSANIIWSPVPRLDLVAEFLSGCASIATDFWSADSRFVAFFADRKDLEVALGLLPPQHTMDRKRLARVATQPNLTSRRLPP